MKNAVKILRSGGVIAFPTETVFGIGACLDQPEAIKRIFRLKKRSRKKPLQILVASLGQAKKYGRFNKQALALAKQWPGPLTLVVYKTKLVPRLVTGGSNKVGLRVPDHKITLALIRKCGPIVATSANLSGEKPALRASSIKINVDYVVAGKTKTGKASTVLDATLAAKVLRA
jgi:L-threonylcarbamoyladenylate synthase